MSDKFQKQAIIQNHEDACEIIELMSDEIGVLARAFQVIAEVCKESQISAPEHEEEQPEYLIN